MKIRVMVVEDEPMIRMGIVSVLPWEELGCEVVAEAENGLEGIKKAEIYHPQLVISDIRMPKMDGLSMAEHLKQMDSDIQIILLTGFQEFAYAKRAIQYRVREYIVKPVDQEELLCAVVKLSGYIRNSLESSAERERLRSRAEESASILKEKFLASLLFHSEDSEFHIYGKMEEFQIEVGDFAVLSASVDSFYELEKCFTEEDIHILLFLIEEQLEMLLEDASFSYTTFRHEKTVYAIVFGSEDMFSGGILGEYAKRLEKGVESSSRFHISAGFSDCHRGADQIRVARSEADACVAEKRRQSRNRFIMDKAVVYMKENAGRELSQEEVADYLHISKWYFSKVFHKETGTKFSEYMGRIRIEEAKRMIREHPELKNYEISDRLGFGNVRYFAQLFKKVTGKTPSEFRG